MTCAHAEAVLNTKNVAESSNIIKLKLKGLINMLEFEEYRLSLDALEKDINELRDSL